MDVNVRYLGGRKFVATARDHQVLSDQPPDNGGADSAMTPPELFLASLGTCAAYYAAEYLRTRGLACDELEIRVQASKGDKPVRIVSVQVDVVAPGLNERHREGVLRAVNACLIKNTLRVPTEIEVRMTSPAEQLSA